MDTYIWGGTVHVSEVVKHPNCIYLITSIFSWIESIMSFFVFDLFFIQDFSKYLLNSYNILGTRLGIGK